MNPSSKNGRTLEISIVAARMACWLWGVLAIIAAVALLALLALNRADVYGVGQPLLFRLILEASKLVPALEAMRLPGLAIDPRRLNHYANRDFDDVFLIGSTLIAFAFAAGVWMTFLGLGQRKRWAFRNVAGLCSVAAVTIAAYAAWCIWCGASADALAVIAFAAAVPAVLTAGLFQQAVQHDQMEHPPAGRRDPLTRPVLLFILSIHSALVLPALACAWVLAGILVRRVWLAWAS